MAASRGCPPARSWWGRLFAPNIVRSLVTFSRERVRSTTVSNSLCIRQPSANNRFRLYSTW
jgi:hypothetical protein